MATKKRKDLSAEATDRGSEKLKLGNDLKEKIKRLLLEDIFDDLTSPFKKDIKIFKNKRLDKSIDKVIYIARKIYIES